MLGLNSGLLGVRRTPTTVSASGIWAPNEQSLAKRAAIWPRTDNPIPALSPVLWYDFADESTVTTSSGEITQITDKGSRGWTLTKSATGPQYVTGINGRKCLDWGNSNHSNYLRNTDTTSTNIAEIYVVMDNAGGTSGNYVSYGGLLTGTGGGAWFLLGYNTSYTASATFNRAYINGSTADRFSSSHFGSPSVDDPALVRIANDSSSALTATDGIQIGTDRTFGNRGWKGLIGEYVIFSSVLNSTDRDAVQTWLATKWGITLV